MGGSRFHKDAVFTEETKAAAEEREESGESCDRDEALERAERSL